MPGLVVFVFATVPYVKTRNQKQNLEGLIALWLECLLNWNQIQDAFPRNPSPTSLFSFL